VLRRQDICAHPEEFAYLECKVVDMREEYGDHAIAILEVVEAGLMKHAHPLTLAELPWRYGG
jgi:flavin reductase (DIM6/NTAB) family NADH-FMN oxidoreductase RutF